MKNIWLMFSVLMLVFVPLRIISIFNPISFVESGWFTFIFFLSIFIIGALAYMMKIDKKNIEIKKNIPLGLISIGVAIGFFGSISTYYLDESQYDFEWQPVMMASLSILSAISFIIMSTSFFKGKNLFSKLSFFIFCPVFWFAFDMILFLSIQNENVDNYDIALTALFALFFLYFTQVFFTSSKLNITKLLIGLGLPTVTLACVKCIPIAIRILTDRSNLSDVAISDCFMESFAALFILFVVFEINKQISKKSEVLSTSN